MLPRFQVPQVVKEDAIQVTTIAVVLNAALDAYRDGRLDELIRRRPGALRWVTRQYLQPILGAAGDAAPQDRPLAWATETLLTWGVTQLRPDNVPDLTITDRQAWLERTSWRPFIALMCHYGFAPVPNFPDRYLRRRDEPPAENLCGLWNIGPSTFYRYLEKGKRQMARLFQEQRLDRRHTPTLRVFVQRDVYRRLNLSEERERQAWHRLQYDVALGAKDYLSALWHVELAHDFDQAAVLIQRHLLELANQSEFNSLLDALRSQNLIPHSQVQLALVDAAVWRVWNDAEREREAYERALGLAVSAKDDSALGIVYSQLGKYYESRDSDRAFAYYQDSIELLAPLIERGEAAADPQAREEYVGTLVKLAWLYTLRNDPRAQALLSQAESLQSQAAIDEKTLALLEQAWGEYWRRAGNLQQALEHKHRALNIYERLGDTEGKLKTYVNLGLIYGDLKDFSRAVDYNTRVLQLADGASVDPEHVVSAYMNLGATEFWRGDYDAAILNYRLALDRCTSATLALHEGRAHYNLAEAFYTKYTHTRDPENERQGDAHVAAAIQVWTRENVPAFVEVTHKLKPEILGRGSVDQVDRLLPQETAVHYPEMAGVEKQRTILTAPGKPEDHIRAHLAIANAYLAISTKEREQALQLCEKHGLSDRFAAEFEQLRNTFERELTREQRLSAAWRTSADLIDDERRARVLEHLLAHGSINKSTYTQLCGVGLATASKHLARLAEMNLLRQIGKGPATRYVLPGE